MRTSALRMPRKAAAAALVAVGLWAGPAWAEAPGGGMRESILRPPWELSETPATARAFVDCSASMSGFQRSPGLPFYELCDWLKSQLYQVGIYEIQGCRFGSTVARCAPIAGLRETVDWPRDESETCLPLVFRHHLEQDTVSGGSKALLLVLTDGVISTKRSQCAAGCEGGNDVSCLAEAVSDFVCRGYGFWMVGLRVPFDGTYYPESGGAKPYRTSAVRRRPMYCWIGSADVETGRAVTSGLIAWAARQKPPIETLPVEVWPGDWSAGWRLALLSEDDVRPDMLQASPAFQVKYSGRKTCTLRQVVGFPDLVVRVTCSRERPVLWIGSVPVQPAGSLPPSGVLPLIRSECGWPPIVAGGKLFYTPDEPDRTSATKLDFCVELLESKVELSLPWKPAATAGVVAAWSTDDDTREESLGRTVNLEPFLGLVANRLLRRTGGVVRVPLLQLVKE